MSIDRYRQIAKNQLETTPISIKTSIPIPTDVDYLNGYINRFFVQKSNDDNGAIYEVNNNEFLKVISNPFYKGTKVKWRLVGSIHDVMNSNSASIKIASSKIKNLSVYLPNLLQFHK